MRKNIRKSRKLLSPGENLKEERGHLLTNKSSFYVQEAFKSLRTNVMFSLTGESGSKVVIVSSANQGEGKSTTAINLAISFAMAGKMTIIIDCDMRRPKITRLMDVSSEVGLSNVLMQPSLCGQAIMSTWEENLHVMSAGDIPPNPSELLGSNRMHQLIDALKVKYDYIILDTPPLNVVTDAMVLSPLSDGVLFVVRSGISERRSVTRAVDQLHYANAKILGFVLTDVYEKPSSYGKKYGYGYGYGYSAQSGD